MKHVTIAAVERERDSYTLVNKSIVIFKINKINKLIKDSFKKCA